MKTRSSDDEIRLRVSVSGFASFLDEQTPLEHDVFSHLKNALLKHGSDFVREPIVQLTADVNSQVLRTLTANFANQLTEPRLGVLEQPMPRSRLGDARFRMLRFGRVNISSHAD